MWNMSDTALAVSLLTVVQELSALESEGVTCLHHMRHFVRRNVRLQELGSLLEALVREDARSREASDATQCAFCSKNARDVHVVVRGLSAAICDECIAICEHVLRERNQRWFSWRALVSRLRAARKRAQCDRIVAGLISLAANVVGRNDGGAGLRRMLASAPLTAAQTLYLTHFILSASTADEDATEVTAVCSFCGRTDREMFVKAIEAVICNACIESASATARSDALAKP